MSQFAKFQEERKNNKRIQSHLLQVPSVANPNGVQSETTVGCITGKESILVSPILMWTERDVWEFLNNVVEVPHCELYDRGRKRIGCICCPMSNAKQLQMDIQDYPHVKRLWIKAIKSIRSGGVCKTKLESTEACGKYDPNLIKSLFGGGDLRRLDSESRQTNMEQDGVFG